MFLKGPKTRRRVGRRPTRGEWTERNRRSLSSHTFRRHLSVRSSRLGTHHEAQGRDGGWDSPRLVTLNFLIREISNFPGRDVLPDPVGKDKEDGTGTPTGVLDVGVWGGVGRGRSASDRWEGPSLRTPTERSRVEPNVPVGPGAPTGPGFPSFPRLHSPGPQVVPLTQGPSPFGLGVSVSFGLRPTSPTLRPIPPRRVVLGPSDEDRYWGRGKFIGLTPPC